MTLILSSAREAGARSSGNSWRHVGKSRQLHLEDPTSSRASVSATVRFMTVCYSHSGLSRVSRCEKYCPVQFNSVPRPGAALDNAQIVFAGAARVPGRSCPSPSIIIGPCPALSRPVFSRCTISKTGSQKGLYCITYKRWGNISKGCCFLVLNGPLGKEYGAIPRLSAMRPRGNGN